MRWSGLREERRRAISPDSVKTAVSLVFISSAAAAVASQSARLMRPVCLAIHLLMSAMSLLRPASADSMMRAIVATAATG